MDTENLQKQLKEFGLNPTDWDLIKKSKNDFLIQNKEDSDFKFLGVLDDKKGAWFRISWLEN